MAVRHRRGRVPRCRSPWRLGSGGPAGQAVDEDLDEQLEALVGVGVGECALGAALLGTVFFGYLDGHSFEAAMVHGAARDRRLFGIVDLRSAVYAQTARPAEFAAGTEDEMNSRLRTYTAYSIGVAIVWAILLVLVAALASAGKRNNIFVVFFGFAIGWVSATIARYVYPPPKKYRQDSDPAS